MRHPLLAVLMAASVTLVWASGDDIVANITISGAETIPFEVKEQILANLRATVTDGDQLQYELQERLRDELQQRGYFLAEVSKPVMVPDAKLKTMAVTVQIKEGSIYRCGIVRFENAKQFSSGQLRALVPISSGEIFAVDKIRQGLHSLRELYGEQGYIDFTPIPNTKVQEDTGVIDLIFDLDEGDQYRIGNLILIGQEPHAGAGKQLLDAWKPHIGQVYNSAIWIKTSDAARRGVRNSTVDAVLATAIQNAGIGSVEVSQHNDIHTVDFRFEFPDPK